MRDGSSEQGSAPARRTRDGAGEGWWQRRRRLAAGIGAAAAVALVAFGMFAAVGGLSGPASASSVIPSPPSKNKFFVEDDNGTGADNQANLLDSVAPGLVHVLSANGQPAGVGIILTPSGLVLTSDQVVSGGGKLSVRTVLSGRPFAARVLGASAADDLALIQIDGASTPFKPVAVGNSRYFAVGAAVTALGSAWRRPDHHSRPGQPGQSPGCQYRGRPSADRIARVEPASAARPGNGRPAGQPVRPGRRHRRRRRGQRAARQRVSPSRSTGPWRWPRNSSRGPRTKRPARIPERIRRRP